MSSNAASNAAASTSQGGTALATTARNTSFSATVTPASNAATASQHRYDIPFLEEDGNNYDSWQRRLCRLLKLRRLWTVVDGTYTRPDGTDATALSDWVANNEEAHAQIEFTIKDGGPLNTVADATSAKDAWDKLSECYAGKGTHRVGTLMSKVFNTKLNDAEPLENQIDEFLRTIRTINSLGHPFDDHLAAVTLINAIPSMSRPIPASEVDVCARGHMSKSRG